MCETSDNGGPDNSGLQLATSTLRPQHPIPLTTDNLSVLDNFWSTGMGYLHDGNSTTATRYLHDGNSMTAMSAPGCDESDRTKHFKAISEPECERSRQATSRRWFISLTTNATPMSGDPSKVSRIALQPKTQPISGEQLLAEVKGIYAGLVMVEEKCKEVDQGQDDLDHKQWQACTDLHQTLLDEHHDFFLASQYPSATPAVLRLANEYEMPARLWQHGIHSFLELLRRRLPKSIDHMETFTHLAYNIMISLYETIPAFEEKWTKCLGDLARCGMAIEGEQEMWSQLLVDGIWRHGRDGR